MGFTFCKVLFIFIYLYKHLFAVEYPAIPQSTWFRHIATGHTSQRRDLFPAEILIKQKKYHIIK